ncbi:serine aminopeptidase domain-containing protein [Legionella cherrii]|uniref:Predicted dienelactone hydrolase n=1 Tax=Legionella cherrii TaxID=28084 RepID=A0ABY6TA89_9GAMM|nr:alpha/beta hydrolase [Legionella cherrii]VEB38054.1 Predicted dienelactone hydrolase [Legionella cherrii]
MKIRGFVLILVTTLLIPNLAYSTLIWKETYLPMNTANGPVKLEALLVFSDDKIKHPLALISHGSPRNPQDRPNMTALSYLPIAYEFARRGYSVAVVLRRGYGSSGGGWAEGLGSCNNPNYMKAAQSAVEDLNASVDFLGTLKQFDTSKFIAVGVSAGGFASIALTALNPPPGLKAVINFAGGRGSSSDNKVCNENALISTFAQFGKGSKVPTLWIYAKNDHFFNPQLAKKLFTAFTGAGGNAVFIQANSFGKEGHFLFSKAGIPQWAPMVDLFLKSNQLILVNSPLVLPVSSLKTPGYLSNSAKKAFLTYRTAPPHKAFAVSENRSYGWRSGQPTKEIAEQKALKICNQFSASGCKLIAVDEELLH